MYGRMSWQLGIRIYSVERWIELSKYGLHQYACRSMIFVFLIVMWICHISNMFLYDVSPMSNDYFPILTSFISNFLLMSHLWYVNLAFVGVELI